MLYDKVAVLYDKVAVLYDKVAVLYDKVAVLYNNDKVKVLYDLVSSFDPPMQYNICVNVQPCMHAAVKCCNTYSHQLLRKKNLLKLAKPKDKKKRLQLCRLGNVVKYIVYDNDYIVGTGRNILTQNSEYTGLWERQGV